MGDGERIEHTETQVFNEHVIAVYDTVDDGWPLIGALVSATWSSSKLLFASRLSSHAVAHLNLGDAGELHLFRVGKVLRELARSEEKLGECLVDTSS